jgi:hypothetical protein
VLDFFAGLFQLCLTAKMSFGGQTPTIIVLKEGESFSLTFGAA